MIQIFASGYLDLRLIKVDEKRGCIYFNQQGTKEIYCLQEEGSWGKICVSLYICDGCGVPLECIDIKTIRTIDCLPELELCRKIKKGLTLGLG